MGVIEWLAARRRTQVRRERYPYAAQQLYWVPGARIPALAPIARCLHVGLVFVSVLVLCGGAVLPAGADEDLLPGQDEPRVIENPRPDLFSVCYSHGCSRVNDVSLTSAQWETVRELFGTPASSSAEERERIARAIAKLETMVGVLAGTAGDRGGNMKGFFVGHPQLDCVDEATNTTTYLRMIENDGLLEWHRVSQPRARGLRILRLPHNTAVVTDLSDERSYAVDSWFDDNGIPPAVVPLAVWADGWHPGDAIDPAQ